MQPTRLWLVDDDDELRGDMATSLRAFAGDVVLTRRLRNRRYGGGTGRRRAGTKCPLGSPGVSWCAFL